MKKGVYMVFRICLALSVAGLSSCEKEQEASPVCISCSFDAEGGREDYNLDLDGASLTLDIKRAYYSEYGAYWLDESWVDVAYCIDLERLSIVSDENETGRARRAVVSARHRVTGQKYIFEIEQSE